MDRRVLGLHPNGLEAPELHSSPPLGNDSQALAVAVSGFSHDKSLVVGALAHVEYLGGYPAVQHTKNASGPRAQSKDSKKPPGYH